MPNGARPTKRLPKLRVIRLSPAPWPRPRAWMMRSSPMTRRPSGTGSPDVVVNNPQNSVSMPGDTARLQAEGRIRYDSYVRSIEYAGRLDDLVLLMGEERVVR